MNNVKEFDPIRFVDRFCLARDIDDEDMIHDMYIITLEIAKKNTTPASKYTNAYRKIDEYMESLEHDILEDYDDVTKGNYKVFMLETEVNKEFNDTYYKELFEELLNLSVKRKCHLDTFNKVMLEDKTMREVAKEYNVSVSNVARIVNTIIWRMNRYARLRYDEKILICWYNVSEIKKIMRGKC